MRPVCLACVSFDVEAITDEEAGEFELFACFECRDVFSFMADGQPRRRRHLALFELYENSRA